MNEQKMRTEVAKRRPWLKEDDNLERVWGYLDELGFIQDADAQDDPVAYVVQQVDKFVAAAPTGVGRRRLQGRGRTQEVILTPQLDPRERERAGAFEEHLAKVAITDPGVLRFRNKALGGGLLTQEEARAFVTSDAARFFVLGLFQSWGIPLVDHTSELIEYKSEREGTEVWNYATVIVDPPGITRTVQAISVEPHSDLLSVWAGSERATHPRDLTFPGEDGRVEGIRVWKKSLLGELHELSEELAERYSWQEAQATWFVLTGEIPAAPPLKLRYQSNSGNDFTNGVITLEVAPWMPAKVVHHAFRSLQQRVLGGDNHPTSEKNLRLFRFVTERIDPDGLLKEGHTDAPNSDLMTSEKLVANLRYEKMPEGSGLVKEWDNQEWVRKDPKKRACGQDTRRFWRDYHRARRAVAYPSYKRPNELQADTS